MKKVVLDTNFILTSVKQKIDFIEEITLMGIKIIIPLQVIRELEKVAESKKKLKFRDDANLALKLLKQSKFEEIDLKERYVDKGLIKYAEENKSVIIATLDKDIKNKVNNHKLVIRERKRLEII